MFFVAAAFGIFIGLVIAGPGQGLYITMLGVVNLCLGGFMAYLLMTQKPKAVSYTHLTLPTILLV